MRSAFPSICARTGSSASPRKMQPWNASAHCGSSTSHLRYCRPVVTTIPFLLLVLTPWKAIYGVCFAVLIALIIIERELSNTDTIPLTCSYLPGKRNILHTGIIYWLTVFGLTSILTAFEAIGAANPVRAALTIGVLALILFRTQTREPSSELPELRFDDIPEPAVATLGLARE